MRIFLVAFFLLSTFFVCAHDSPERFSLALSLHDMKEAKILLEDMMQRNPPPPDILKLKIQYFLATNDFNSIQKIFKTLTSEEKKTFPPDLTEKIAWAIIENAQNTSHPRIRVEAAIAAGASHDIKGVRILHKLLGDPHQSVQQCALSLALPYGDSSIQERAEHLALSPMRNVNIAAAQLLTAQKAPSAKKTLLILLKDENLSEKDLFEIIKLLVSLKEDLDLSWVKEAVQSSSMPTRAFAAASLMMHPSSDWLKIIYPLLHDNSSSVKELALSSFGLFQSFFDNQQELSTIFYENLSSHIFSIQATAAWALLLSQDPHAKERGTAWFTKAFENKNPEEVMIVVSRLIKSGNEGLSLAKNALSTVSDPFAKLNLAVYLLLHRTSTPEASQAIQEILSSQILISQHEETVFSWIGKASSYHDQNIPRLPETEDLFTRLFLIALKHYSGCHVDQKELESMLHDRSWGASAATAQFLFQEMLSLEEVLKPLLASKEESIRIQAVLLLAIFSRSDEAAKTLLDQYERSSKEGKEILLTGFYFLPAAKTREVLFPLLFDESQLLRTRAAGIFLASVYQ